MPEQIVIKNLGQVRGKFKAVQSAVRPWLHSTMNKAVLYVHSTVPPYPPKPAGSTYRRTETLGREITTEVRDIGTDVVGLIGSNTVYSPWVISDEKIGDRGPQARVHRGRWWTLQGVVEKARNAVVKIFQDAAGELTNKF